MEDQLFYLCGHGASHFWQQLFWLVDVAEIVRKYHPIDWHPILISAHRQNTDRILGQGVILAHLFLNNPLPEPVGALAQRDLAVLKLVKKAIQHFQMPAGNSPTVAGFGLHLIYRMMLSREIKFKLLIFMQILFCPDCFTWARMMTEVYHRRVTIWDQFSRLKQQTLRSFV